MSSVASSSGVADSPVAAPANVQVTTTVSHEAVRPIANKVPNIANSSSGCSDTSDLQNAAMQSCRLETCEVPLVAAPEEPMQKRRMTEAAPRSQQVVLPDVPAFNIPRGSLKALIPPTPAKIWRSLPTQEWLGRTFPDQPLLLETWVRPGGERDPLLVLLRRMWKQHKARVNWEGM